jgi:hypothetical protein
LTNTAFSNCETCKYNWSPNWMTPKKSDFNTNRKHVSITTLSDNKRETIKVLNYCFIYCVLYIIFADDNEMLRTFHTANYIKYFKGFIELISQHGNFSLQTSLDISKEIKHTRKICKPYIPALMRKMVLFAISFKFYSIWNETEVPKTASTGYEPHLLRIKILHTVSFEYLIIHRSQN